VREFSGNGRRAEVGGHGKVGNGGGGEDDGAELVEEALTAGDGKVPPDDYEVGKQLFLSVFVLLRCLAKRSGRLEDAPSQQTRPTANCSHCA
jgi:hypothetical protein